jgi:hypothetical protein
VGTRVTLDTTELMCMSQKLQEVDIPSMLQFWELDEFRQSTVVLRRLLRIEN